MNLTFFMLQQTFSKVTIVILKIIYTKISEGLELGLRTTIFA